VSVIKRMGTGLTFTGIVVAVVATAIPSALHAQAKLELTPFLGSYYALTKLCKDCNNNGDGSDLTSKQLSAFAIGGRLSYWVSNTIGIEGAFTYTPSQAEERFQVSDFGLAVSGKGRIMQASGRLLFRPQRTNLHFTVGAGIVSRGDSVWQAFQFRSDSPDSVGAKLTSVVGILGLGVRASVTPKFALNVAAEVNLYSFDPRLAAVPATSSANGGKLQADLLVSVGVPITLAH
jgi:hypothetical protein